MADSFAGKGGKKPQIEIPIDLINLDVENPRLVQYISKDTVTEMDLMDVMYNHFDTEVIALSLIENGYFDEEPIIVVPDKVPDGFSFDSYKSIKDLEEALSSLIEQKTITFTVVEGNRRISTIKLLLSRELRDQLGINRIYPSLEDPEKIKDISMIPSICYKSRKQVSPYLGVRHIAGLLKWEAFAKASYVADMVKDKVTDGQAISEAIKSVQKVVADRSDVLIKQYVTYNLYQEAQERLDEYDTRPLLNRFSLLQVLYNSGAIREYIGVPGYSKVDFTQDNIVPEEKLARFQEVLTWIFGDKEKSIEPVLTDSRQITSRLSHIVKSDEAVRYLREHRNLEEAYERTDGEREYLSNNMTRATRALQTSLQFAYKYKGDRELLAQLDELEKLLAALKSNLSS